MLDRKKWLWVIYSFIMKHQKSLSPSINYFDQIFNNYVTRVGRGSWAPYSELLNKDLLCMIEEKMVRGYLLIHHVTPNRMGWFWGELEKNRGSEEGYLKSTIWKMVL